MPQIGLLEWLAKAFSNSYITKFDCSQDAQVQLQEIQKHEHQVLAQEI